MGSRAYPSASAERKLCPSPASDWQASRSGLYSRSDTPLLSAWLRPARYALRGLFALGFVALAPFTAQAADFYADLDRDGVRDVVTVQGMPSTGLVVWLSGSKSVLLLHTRRPIVHITAADIDGDGRLDLVASDTAAKVHVWHRTIGGKLRPTRPRRAPLASHVGHTSALQRAPDDPVTAVVDDAPSGPPCDTSHPAQAPALNLYDTIVSAPGPARVGPQDQPHQPRAPPPVA
jgi:hypothetical protein